MIFNTLGNRAQIFTFNNIDSYEFMGLNKIKLNSRDLKFNVQIEFEDCKILNPIHNDDLIFFNSSEIEENRNKVYFNFKIKDDEDFYINSSKYTDISNIDSLYPQRINFGDYQNQNHKYMTLSGILTDEQLQNDILLHEDRLLEFSLSNLIGEKEFKKNTSREKQGAEFIGKTIIPFTRNHYEDSDGVSFLYKTEEQVINEYRQTRG